MIKLARFLVCLVFESTVVAVGTSAPARADIASKLRRYVGYTVLDTKTIKGWVSEDRKKHGDSFEGCEFGRLIIFDDNTYLRCTGYSYEYSYRPEAVILARGKSFVMIVDDDAYDMAY